MNRYLPDNICDGSPNVGSEVFMKGTCQHTFLGSGFKGFREHFVTLVPEVFLDFSSRKRSTASREAATTSRVSDEEREKNLWLP